jgi:transposase
MSVAIIPDYHGLMIENISAEESPMRVWLASHATMAPCPRCGLPSTRVCGRYPRILDDLPWGTAALTLHLQVQRFRCETPTCSQKIFCERIPWAPVYQRRTAAFIQRVLSLAWEMSASAARRSR